MFPSTDLCAALHTVKQRLSPERATFLASLLLSLVALLFNPDLNRDGMLYVETARSFAKEGLPGALTVFSWPFLSILMALLANATGLSFEQTGHLLNALFMAGACALVVACARGTAEERWWVCLVVLALPGLNQYRNELIREYGFWFFSMIAFHLALRVSEQQRLRTALLVPCALTMAALFRPEALVLGFALLLWSLLPLHTPHRLRAAFALALPALLLLATPGLAYLLGLLLPDSRLAAEFSRVDYITARGVFDTKAAALASSLIPYAQNQAGNILFWGSMALVPIKLIKQAGVFLAPLLTAPPGTLRRLSKQHALLLVAALTHACVLCVFALNMQFLAGRYGATLLLFLAPALGSALYLSTQRFPRLRLAALVLAMLIALGNVVSFAPKKPQFDAAGRWLTAHVEYSNRVYLESARAAYHANWPVNRHSPPENRATVFANFPQSRFDWFVFEVEQKKNQEFDDWLRKQGLREVQRFSSSSGSQIVIAVP